MKSPLAASRPGSLDIRPAARERATPIREFVFMSQGASNAYLVTTSDGDVLINTGLGVEAPVHKRCFEQASGGPIRFIVLTQGHVDHVGGIDLFRAAHPGARVVAQRNIVACQADDERIKAFRHRRNLRFYPEFLAPLPAGGAPPADGGLGRAQSVARPDLTFEDEYRFELGGVRFELLAAPGGETIDSALVWLPQHRILFSGNALGPLFPHMPNFYTIRGDRLRFAEPYLAVVEKMIELEPDLLVTGHFEPIEGREVIAAELVRLRDAVRYVHDRTVAGMNADKDVFELMTEIRLPPELEVGEDYGTVPWAVRAIYEGYAGWFRFRSTTELYDVPADRVYAELADLAGCDALARAAHEKLAADRPLDAVHFAEIALAREPRHREAWQAYVGAHERLLAQSHARNRWQKYWLEGEIARGRRALGELDEMLQVRIHGPGDVRVDDVAVPECGPRDVLVAVSRCGICGTDLGYVAIGGVLGPMPAPMALGHEIAGRVVTIGEEVGGFSLGQRVAVNPMAAFNMIGNGGPEGGFAPTLRVRNARLGETLHALPDALDDEMGALVEPMAVGMHAANVAEVRPGDSVVVVGAGAVGLAVVASLRARGVSDVVAVDLSRPRLARAERLGARAVVDAGREDFFGAVAALQGSDQVFGQPVLATRVFVDAAGVTGAIDTILGSAGFGARVVVAGVHKHPVPIDLRMVLAREIRIQGAIGYPTEFPAAIDALVRGGVDVAAMVSHRYELRDFAQALAMASRPEDAGKVMVVMPESA